MEILWWTGKLGRGNCSQLLSMQTLWSSVLRLIVYYLKRSSHKINVVDIKIICTHAESFASYLIQSHKSHTRTQLCLWSLFIVITRSFPTTLSQHRQTKLEGQSWAWEMELHKYETTADGKNECNVYSCTINKNILSWILQQICLRPPATSVQRESFKEL